MPLWTVFHPEGTFEDIASKKAISEDITKIYTDIGLPAFYVVVNFLKMAPGNTFVGGNHERETPFIRFVIEHIAVNQPNEDEAYKRVNLRIKRALKPHVANKGYDWEFHVDETERRLWMINGMVGPPFGSDEEKQWAKENRPTEWSGAYY